MNKSFGKVKLSYKISYIAEFKNNSSFISTESHQEILPHYEDSITSLLLALAQYFSKPSNFSKVCHKPVCRTNVLTLSMTVPSDNFHGALI